MVPVKDTNRQLLTPQTMVLSFALIKIIDIMIFQILKSPYITCLNYPRTETASERKKDLEDGKDLEKWKVGRDCGCSFEAASNRGNQ